MNGDRDRGSERALCCDGKLCFILERGAEAGVRGSVAVMVKRLLSGSVHGAVCRQRKDCEGRQN